ncbi:SHOCT domain-containing protein [bacterium]|nr:MAG: SHOCT domain-containing protein [bacterium]
MYGYYNDYGYGMMNSFGGGFMMLAFWALIMWLIYMLVRDASIKNKNSGSSALEILKERYAKGEIEKKEFEEKKKDLK